MRQNEKLKYVETLNINPQLGYNDLINQQSNLIVRAGKNTQHITHSKQSTTNSGLLMTASSSMENQHINPHLRQSQKQLQQNFNA